MVIGTYLQKMNSIYFIYKNQWLEVLRVTSIGVRRSTPPSARGTRISAMAISTSTLRSSHSMFAQLGLFDDLTILDISIPRPFEYQEYKMAFYYKLPVYRDVYKLKVFSSHNKGPTI